jgi:hypothetical protein
MKTVRREHSENQAAPPCPFGCQGTAQYRENRNGEAVFLCLVCGASFATIILARPPKEGRRA